jgi:hypothetical protein
MEGALEGTALSVLKTPNSSRLSGSDGALPSKALRSFVSFVVNNFLVYLR